MATIILVFIVLTVVAVFSVQNALPVAITFFFWKFEASLAIVIFLSVLFGMIAAAVIVSMIRFKPKGKKGAPDTGHPDTGKTEPGL
ncbi:MAG: LapA family protein [Nitrospirota bacterium]